MLFQYRLPTLVVYAPVSPTRTYLNMAQDLTRSLRVCRVRYRDVREFRRPRVGTEDATRLRA